MQTTNSHSDAPDFADVYARFSSSLDVSDLPRSVVAAARLNIFDTLACSIAGLGAPGAQEVMEIVREWGGKPEAEILWTDLRVPAPHAAWINSIMAHACDYDDTHDKASTHGGISVLPAALAAVGIADHKISGKEFYAAIIAGLELICRIGVATRISLVDAGFIYSALFSYFAATAAAARILRLSPEQTLNAIGIAYSQAAGTHQVTRDGALTKRMQPAFGARAALTAVVMARKGVGGVRNVFEGFDGLGRTYLQSSLDSNVLREGLGERWHFQDLGYKPYPCCRMNHCPIDAALALRAQPGFDWRKVTEIRAVINTPGNQAVGVPLQIRRAPNTVVEAQFSICYTIACALVNGTVSLSDFTSEALLRPDVRGLAARVTPVVETEFDRAFITPARVEALIDGKIFTVQVETPKGGPENPMSSSDLYRKLEDCLTFRGFDSARATAFDKAVDALENSSDVAADIRKLIQSVGQRVTSVAQSLGPNT